MSESVQRSASHFLFQIEAGHLRQENIFIFIDHIRRIIREAENVILELELKTAELTLATKADETNSVVQTGPDVGNVNKMEDGTKAEGVTKIQGVTDVVRVEGVVKLEDAIKVERQLQATIASESADPQSSSSGQGIETALGVTRTDNEKEGVQSRKESFQPQSSEVKTEDASTKGSDTVLSKVASNAKIEDLAKSNAVESEKVIVTSPSEETKQKETLHAKKKLGRFAISKAVRTKPENEVQSIDVAKDGSEKNDMPEPAKVKTEIHRDGQKSPEIHATVSYEKDHVKLLRAESKSNESMPSEPKGIEKVDPVSSNDIASPQVSDVQAATPVESGKKGRIVSGRFAVNPAVVSDTIEDGKKAPESQSVATKISSQDSTQKARAQPQAATTAENENCKQPLVKAKSLEDKTVPKSTETSRTGTGPQVSEGASQGKTLADSAAVQGKDRSQGNTKGQRLFRVGSGESVDEMTPYQLKTPADSPRKCLSPTGENPRYGFDLADTSRLTMSSNSCFTYSADSLSDRSVPPDLISDTSSLASSGLDSPAVTPSLTPSSSFENLLNFDTPKATRNTQANQVSDKVPFERSISLNNVSITRHLSFVIGVIIVTVVT